MKRILLGAVALLALAAPAAAADMQARTYTKAPAYTPPQVIYNWTGFYIGGHVGGAFAGDSSFQSSDARFLGGVQGGFDYQFAPNWVMGVEAQYSWLPTNNGGATFPLGTQVTSNTDQLGSVTGRIGYTWGPALLYAKGGYAWRNGGLGVNVAGRPAALHRHRQQQGRLYRWRWPRIHVRAELVGQGRVPILQLRQHDDHLRSG
ncbi:opacity protein-like surface antigen [Bradyrhizobium sp. GM7.3]